MQALLNALSRTFLHSMWQGILAAVLAAIIISLTKKSSAKLRYNLLGALLVCFLITSCITFLIDLQKQHEGISSINNAGTNELILNKPAAPTRIVTTISSWLDKNSTLLLSCWFIFFLLHCIKMITGLASVQRLRRYKTYPVPQEWKTTLQKLQDQLGLQQKIIFLQSAIVKVPVALGFLKPVILLPVGLINNLPAEQVEAILLHELGHIRRRDYLVNLLQHAAEAIFFFNPAILWISSLLKQEREVCCDEIVLQHTKQKKNYLNALVSFQEYAQLDTTYAIAVTGKKQYLLNRVKKIITNENKHLNFTEKLTLLSGLLLFSAFTYINREKEVAFPVIDKPLTEVYTIPLYSAPGETDQTIRLTEQALQIKIIANHAEMSKKTDSPTFSINAGIQEKFSKLSSDTLPIIKKSVAGMQSNSKKPATEAEEKLGEIIKLKEHIGEKKESIGKKKVLLETTTGNNKEAILKEIEKERAEIVVKREVLETKRSEYEKLKQNDQKNADSEKNPENKWKIKKDEKPDFNKDKTIEFKLVHIKEIKLDNQAAFNGEMKFKLTEKTIEQRAPVKPNPPKNKPATPVRI